MIVIKDARGEILVESNADTFAEAIAERELAERSPIDGVLAEVRAELVSAMEKHSSLNSHHEAYAVILEEMDEFKAEVWKKRAERDRARIRAELIQIAAMAVRAVLDCVDAATAPPAEGG